VLDRCPGVTPTPPNQFRRTAEDVSRFLKRAATGDFANTTRGRRYGDSRPVPTRQPNGSLA
jgi:hypothetical protein